MLTVWLAAFAPPTVAVNVKVAGLREIVGLDGGGCVVDAPPPHAFRSKTNAARLSGTRPNTSEVRIHKAFALITSSLPPIASDSFTDEKMDEFACVRWHRRNVRNLMVACEDAGVVVLRDANRRRRLRILRRCAYEAEENACNRSTPHQYALHRAPPNHSEI